MMIMSDISTEPTYSPDVASEKPRWGGKRRGAGRPSEVEEPVRFTFDLERSDMDALKAISEARGVSVAKIVRGSVRAYLRRQGSR